MSARPSCTAARCAWLGVALLAVLGCDERDGYYDAPVHWLAFERAGSSLSMVERERGVAYRIEVTDLESWRSIGSVPLTRLSGRPLLAVRRNGESYEQLVLTTRREGDDPELVANLFRIGGPDKPIALEQRATDIVQATDGMEALLFSREQSSDSAATSESAFQWVDLDGNEAELVTADNRGGSVRFVTLSDGVEVGGQKFRFAVAAFERHLVLFERELDEKLEVNRYVIGTDSQPVTAAEVVFVGTYLVVSDRERPLLFAFERGETDFRVKLFQLPGVASALVPSSLDRVVVLTMTPDGLTSLVSVGLSDDLQIPVALDFSPTKLAVYADSKDECNEHAIAYGAPAGEGVAHIDLRDLPAIGADAVQHIPLSTSVDRVTLLETQARPCRKTETRDLHAMLGYAEGGLGFLNLRNDELVSVLAGRDVSRAEIARDGSAIWVPMSDRILYRIGVIDFDVREFQLPAAIEDIVLFDDSAVVVHPSITGRATWVRADGPGYTHEDFLGYELGEAP
jgi:hypothetical protein